MMLKENSLYYFLILATILVVSRTFADPKALGKEEEEEGGGGVWTSGPVVKREERRSLVSTEYGHISAARVTDNINGSYLLHFFTLEPNALFLPVILHADMVFYIQTGSGRLSWTKEDELKRTDIRRGDIYRLQQGSVFFIQSSNLEEETSIDYQTEKRRQKLRIHAIFTNSNYDLREPATGPYSSIRDMVTGFERNVLQAAFNVPEEVIDELLSGTEQPAIIHGITRTENKAWDVEAQFIRGVIGSSKGSYNNVFELNKKKEKKKDKDKDKDKKATELFNIFSEEKDFENCNGWSTAVTRTKLSALRDSDIGLFMVNLTTGSMMGPHWNPMATEIAIVLQGRGMVRVVCSSISNETSCRNTRLLVEEGDVFAVPRFHPMAQISFNDNTFVFVGFSTSTKINYPQFLAGQASVLRTLDRDVLAMSFGVENTTLDRLLAPQHDSVILGCTSCAEEELRIMQEEFEKERGEPREVKGEEARRKEGEERQRREQEEEEEKSRRSEHEEEGQQGGRSEEKEAAEQEAARREEKEEEGGSGERRPSVWT